RPRRKISVFPRPAVSPITGCIHPRERKRNTQYSSGHIYHEAYASFCMTRWSICPPISTLASIRARTSGTHSECIKGLALYLSNRKRQIVAHSMTSLQVTINVSVRRSFVSLEHNALQLL
ncbi:hypothetical protein TSAR_004501, partial [Trichomalopsis sarcophagae]